MGGDQRSPRQICSLPSIPSIPLVHVIACKFDATPSFLRLVNSIGWAHVTSGTGSMAICPRLTRIGYSLRRRNSTPCVSFANTTIGRAVFQFAKQAVEGVQLLLRHAFLQLTLDSSGKILNICVNLTPQGRKR